MVKAAFFSNAVHNVERVYAQGRKEQVSGLTDLYPEVISSDNFAEHVDNLQDLEVIFSTWGMPALSKEQINQLPNLKVVFYGAGSVQKFGRPFLETGITVMSAWGANAVPVAEYTLAQTLLATKGFFRNIRDSKVPDKRINGEPFRGKGNFGETVAIIGAGMIGRKVIKLLKDYQLNIVLYDPYCSDEDAASLGVTKVSLEDAFSQGYVVSNHVPNLPTTKRMLTGKHFELMRDDATFINTGRGATVAEDEMISVLKKRPSVTALLDVTFPEPPERDSELYTLPNVYITSHIAGSIGDEVVRLADYCIEEFLAWQQGKPLKYTVDLQMLETMA